MTPEDIFSRAREVATEAVLVEYVLDNWKQWKVGGSELKPGQLRRLLAEVTKPGSTPQGWSDWVNGEAAKKTSPWAKSTSVTRLWADPNDGQSFFNTAVNNCQLALPADHTELLRRFVACYLDARIKGARGN